MNSKLFCGPCLVLKKFVDLGKIYMYYGKVEICGINTSKLPVLKESKKIELLKKAREGDKAAREEMINGNLRLVLSVVQNSPAVAKAPTIFFRWAASALSKPLTTSTPILT